MQKTKIGIVTAWGECGMGYIAKNWVYTIEKYPELFEYKIFCRAVDKFSPFRWYGNNVTQGYESMDINNSIFWTWIDDYKPDIILFQDQNTYSQSKMIDETNKLQRMGIKLINYADWIYRNDLKNYRGLYNVNLAHINRNYQWFKENKLESPIYIKWGVILQNFPFLKRIVNGHVKFYINLGSGTDRKGYQFIPKALNKMQGNIVIRKLSPKNKSYKFIFSSQKKSELNIDTKFLKAINNNNNCEIIYKTANNQKGGLYNLGDIYIYPSTMEGVGLTITEAMSTGMPVVTTNYPTMNEWFDDDKEGRLINISKKKKTALAIEKVYPNINHLAEIMVDYIDNPYKVTEHSLNARRRIENDYNWDDRDEQIFNLFSI